LDMDDTIQDDRIHMAQSGVLFAGKMTFVVRYRLEDEMSIR
jgi:hypothetical protein